MPNELVTKIRSSGYWESVIRPVAHTAHRVDPITKLFPIIEKASVQIRGWDFPHIDRNDPHDIGQDSISQASEWNHNKEVWRFYQSGQFIDLKGMAYDWRGESGWWPPQPNEQWQPGQKLGMLDAFFTLVEMFEFAARLANSEAGDSEMKIEITVGGLRGRSLYMEDPMRLDVPWGQPATLEKLVLPPVVILRDRLMADPVAPALVAAIALFARFNREIAPDTLRDWLRSLRRR